MLQNLDYAALHPGYGTELKVVDKQRAHMKTARTQRCHDFYNFVQRKAAKGF
jgi:ubiquinone biosynthesis protein Coq4